MSAVLEERPQRGQPSYFEDGVTREAVINCLNGWGHTLRKEGRDIPRWFGWSGQSIAARDPRQGKDPGKEPELTIPELHYDRLRPRQHDIFEVSYFVTGLPFLQYVCITMRHVSKKNRDECATQLGATPKQVRKWLDTAYETLERAFKTRRVGNPAVLALTKPAA